ncbi:MAG: hypothetical protein HY860_04805 [Chlamydiales bacterium]|nr:hypothetical protein [Chlamydiales bacterium]
MTTPSITLKTSGDCFDIYTGAHPLPNPNPLLQQASQCTTRQAVLIFLQQIQHNTTFLEKHHFNHEHYPRYPDHSNNMCCLIPRGSGSAHRYPAAIHHDSIHDMIQFVQRRIDEESTPHELFNKIGRTIGPIIEKLADCNVFTIPVVGIGAAIAVITIGLLQIISGLAISILFCIPALCSKNCAIIAERSSRYILHGSFTMLAPGVIGVIMSIAATAISPLRLPCYIATHCC